MGNELELVTSTREIFQSISRQLLETSESPHLLSEHGLRALPWLLWLVALPVVAYLFQVQMVCVHGSKQLQSDLLMLSSAASWHEAAHKCRQWPLCCYLCIQPALVASQQHSGAQMAGLPRWQA